jgi:hypothetical protein
MSHWAGFICGILPRNGSYAYYKALIPTISAERA